MPIMFKARVCRCRIPGLLGKNVIPGVVMAVIILAFLGTLRITKTASKSDFGKGDSKPQSFSV